MNPNIDTLLGKLPAYQGEATMLKKRQQTTDIEREIMSAHTKHINYYDKICLDHWTGDPYTTARELFYFLQKKVPYREEPVLSQTTKAPQAILQERLIYGADCKHYASYTNGVGDALRRRGVPIKCYYRFASYQKNNRTPRHVYAVWKIGPEEIWIDPTPNTGDFNARRIIPFYVYDKKPPMSNQIGSLYYVAGINDRETMSGYTGNNFVAAGSRLGYTNQRMIAGHFLDRPPAPISGGRAHADPRSMHMGIVDDGMGKGGKGKAKFKKFVQKGKKLALKFNLAPSRNSFLLLVKINMFGLGTKMWLKAAKDKNSPAWKALAAKWVKLGGKVDSLYKSIKEGVGTHNKLHPKKKISGYCSGIYHNEIGFIPGHYDHEIGYIDGVDEYLAGPDSYIGSPYYPADAAVGVPVAIPAAIAAATPIIAALAALLKSFGINTNKAKADGDKAADDLAASHNGSPEDGTGETTHPDGTKSVVKDNPDGSQDLVLKKVPGGSGQEGGGGGGSDVPAATGGDTPAAPGGGAGGSTFKEMFANITNFVSSHKWWFIGTGAAIIVGYFVIPRLAGAKKRRR